MPAMPKEVPVSVSVNVVEVELLVDVKTSESPEATGPLPDEKFQFPLVAQSVLGDEPIHVSMLAALVWRAVTAADDIAAAMETDASRLVN